MTTTRVRRLGGRNLEVNGCRVWGPDVDEHGAKTWHVALVSRNPNTQEYTPVGKVYDVRNFFKARQLAAKIATDKSVEYFDAASIL